MSNFRRPFGKTISAFTRLGEVFKELVLLFSPAPSSQVAQISIILNAWRTQILQGILNGTFLLWIIAFFAVCFNLASSYQRDAILYKHPLLLVFIAGSIYLFALLTIVAATFVKQMKYGVRARVVLALFYGLGTVALWFSGLNGDGRIFLFAFVILTAILLEPREGVSALILCILTFAIAGWMHLTNTNQILTNGQKFVGTVSDWFTGGVIFLLLTGIMLVSTVYLIQAFGVSMTEARNRANQMAALHEVNLNLSRQLALPVLLDEIVGHATRLLAASMGGLYLLNTKVQILELVVLHQLDKNLVGTKLRVGEGLSGLIAQTGKALVVGDYPAWMGRAEKFAELPFRSVLGVPIVWGGETIGVINVHDPEINRFSETDVELVTLFAQLAASAITEARQREAQQRQIRHLNAVNAIAFALNHTNDLNETLQWALQETLSALGLPMGWITLTKGKQFYLAAHHNLPQDLAANDYHKMRWQPCHCQQMVQEGKITKTINIIECQRLENVEEPVKDLSLHASVPIQAGGRVLGLINLAASAKQEFSEESLTFLSSIGHQLGVALARASLHDETVENLNRELQLNKITETISGSLQLSEILDNVVKLAVGLVGADAGALGLVSSDGETISFPYIHFLPAHLLAFSPPRGKGMVWQVIESGEPILSQEYKMHTHALPIWEQEKLYATIVVPLVTQEIRLGVLGLFNRAPNKQFTPRDLSLAESIGRQAGIAIQNARLYEAERHQRIKAETLREATAALTTNLHLSQVLENILVHLAQVVPYDSACVFLHEENYARVAATRGFLQPDLVVGHKFLIEDSPLTLELMKVTHPLLLKDAQHDPRFKKWGNSEHTRGWMGITLRTQGKIFGYLTLDSKEIDAFNGEAAHLAAAFGNQAAVVIANAQLFEEVQNKAAELERLYRAAQALSTTLDPPTILYELARHLTETLDMTSSYIMSINHTSMTILAEFWSEAASLSERKSDLNQSFLFSDYPNSTTAAQSGQNIILQVSDTFLSLSEQAQFKAYGIQTMLYVPIQAHGQTLGIAEMWESRYRREFTPHDIHIVQTLANHAAHIIENAQLFAETQQREKELAALLEIARATSSSLDLSIILRRITTSITHLLNAESSILFKYEPTQHAIRMTAMFSQQEEYDEITTAGMLYLLSEYTCMAKVLATGKPQVINLSDPSLSLAEKFMFDENQFEAALIIPLRVGERPIGLVGVFTSEATRQFTNVEIRLAYALSNQAAVAIEKARLFEAVEQSEAYYRALIENAVDGVTLLDANGQFKFNSPASERILGYHPEALQGRSTFDYIHPADREQIQNLFQDGLRQPDLITRIEFRARHRSGTWIYLEAVAHNLIHNPNVAGVVVNYRDVNERKQAEADLRRYTAELEVLSKVSSALRQARKLEEMLAILVLRSTNVLGGSIGAIYLREGITDEFVARGVYTVGTEPVIYASTHPLRHFLGDGITGHVAQTGQLYISPNIHRDPRRHFIAEDFSLLKDIICQLSLPLYSPDGIIGVMHVGLPHAHTFTTEEIRLLTAIAEIGGNAIHRATLYEETERYAMELEQAYEATIEGWARALELRDEATEGHTRRVASLTIRLAHRMGVDDDELLHIQRGALLHDIGKVGIPDHILLKPGPLTPEEMAVMQNHPSYAQVMLSNIPFLKPAMAIPYSHHEKWDGTGYPQGLKGEEIPLAARIFSVVDVWDALSSDRPYRQGWNLEKIREYIREHSGIDFDPKVVEVFLKMMAERLENPV